MRQSICLNAAARRKGFSLVDCGECIHVKTCLYDCKSSQSIGLILLRYSSGYGLGMLVKVVRCYTVIGQRGPAPICLTIWLIQWFQPPRPDQVSRTPVI